MAPSPTVLVASATARVFEAGELPLTPQACQHLIAAALVASAVSSFEDMQAKGLPVVIDQRQATDTRSGIPTWSRQLRDDAVFDRAGKALARAFKDLGLPLPTGTDLRFLKLRVSDVVTSQIRQQGLFVYTQKLLFSPRFATLGMQVLEKMKLPELPPVAASVAVATGYLPPLPSRNLKEHLQFVKAQQRRSWIGVRGPFAEWIARAAPVVVEFPAPNLAAGRLCRSDRFTIGPRPSAELGMGFFLATRYDQLGDRLSIVTPMLVHSAAPDGSPQPWRAELHANQVPRSLTPQDENRRLERAMKDFGGQSARLQACPSCLEIFSNDRADLKLQCGCGRGG